MSSDIKKNKIAFVVALIFVIAGLIYGVLNLEGRYFWQTEYVDMQLRFLKARMEYMMTELPFLEESKVMKTSRTGEGTYSVPVLLYHGVISDQNWASDGVNISFSDFKKHMTLLKSLGYETVKLDEFLDFAEGKRKLPEKSFLLTFDDGRKDSYYGADPVLRALGYEAVMFVISGRSVGQSAEENTFHLDKTELRKMVQSGRWDIGSHTQNGHDMERIDAEGTTGHFLTNKLWITYEGRLETDQEYAERIRNDLLLSKKEIDTELETNVRAFAYPFGDFGQGSLNFSQSQNVIAKTVQGIFPHSFYQGRESEYTGNFSKGQTFFRRINIDSDISAEKMMQILVDAEEKRRSDFEDRFSYDQGWKESWGTHNFDSGVLKLVPSVAENSSFSFLEGSYLWKNYIFRSKVQLVKGKSFALAGRYRDGSNYASCDFSDSEVMISQYVDGKYETVAQFPITGISFSEMTEVSLSADGERIGCSIGGKEYISGNVSSKLGNGGIGFKVWDEKENNSLLVVKEVLVKISDFSNLESFRGSLTEFDRNDRTGHNGII